VGSDELKATTPVEYAVVTPTTPDVDYQQLCSAAGLYPTEGGWGFLHCVNSEGQRVTRVTDDVAYLEALMEAYGSDSLKGLEIPPDKFPLTRAGWTDEWVDGTVPSRQVGHSCWCGSGKEYTRCHGRQSPKTG
jgi:hypothetical protein